MTDIDAMPVLSPPLAVGRGTALVFRSLGGAALVLAALLVLGLVAYWLNASAGGLAATLQVPPEAFGSLDPARRLGGLLISLPPALLMAWGLLRARACFSEFAAGRPFAARGISGLRDFAIGMGASALLGPVSSTLLGLFLSASMLAGTRQLTLELDSGTLIHAMFAATIAALAWAMRKAALIAEENSQFV